MTQHEAFITAPSRVRGLEQLAGETGADLQAISPPFPEGRAVFFAIRDAVQDGSKRGVQVDWGSWAMLATRADITALLVEIFGPQGDYESLHHGPLNHIAQQMESLRAFVVHLAPDRLYAIVVEEF